MKLKQATQLIATTLVLSTCAVVVSFASNAITKPVKHEKIIFVVSAHSGHIT